jgi:uncharacterized membrane protein
MIRAQSTVTIDRPQSEVFAFFADHTNGMKWRSGVIEIERVSGDGVGATYHQALRGPGGRVIPADFRVVEYLPPERFAFAVTAGPVRPRGIFDFRPMGADVTGVTFTLEVEPRGLMKLMSPMVARQARHSVAELERAKRLLEQS